MDRNSGCYTNSGFKCPEEIGALQSLQKLSFIRAGNERNSSLIRELGKWKQLNRIGIVKLRKEHAREFCSSIEKLTKLQALSVASVDENEIIDLQPLSSPPPFLQRLYLKGPLEALPRWISSLDSPMRLCQDHSQLKDNPLLSPGNLPNLVQLILDQAYGGTKLRFDANDFLKLRVLDLHSFGKLKCVEVEKGSMPCLEKLCIGNCKLMEELPSGVEHLEKLTRLYFVDMPDEFVKKLTQDEQDDYYLKVAHVPVVICGYWRDGPREPVIIRHLCEER